MDCSRCICDRPGFCRLFNKEMTEQPPNWQWCKNTTPEERSAHKQISDKRIALEKEPKNWMETSKKYFTTADLISDTIELLLPKIKKDHKKIAGIVGVPRSGMIPASIIATHLNIPLYSQSKGQMVLLNSFSESGGYRMKHYVENDGPLLFIDDTACGGRVARETKERFPDCIFAVVYSTYQASKNVDCYGQLLEHPHLLEWNMFNSLLAKNMLFDIDGIFCENIPIDICQNSDLYADYIENIEPIHSRIPKLFKAKALVTGRLERYRNITEKWLEKHEFNYNELIMFPNELEQRRNINHAVEVGTYKGRIMSELGAAYFTESEMSEANIIKQMCPSRFVVCPNQRVCL